MEYEITKLLKNHKMLPTPSEWFQDILSDIYEALQYVNEALKNKNFIMDVSDEIAYKSTAEVVNGQTVQRLYGLR